MDFAARLSQIRAERLELEADIADKKARIAEIEAFLAMFEKFMGPVTTHTGARQEHVAAPAPAGKSEEAQVTPATLRDRVLCVVITSLQGGRRTTRELVRILDFEGVPVRQWADPVGTLSAMLSREKQLFDSAPRLGGWGLQPPARVLTSPGPALPLPKTQPLTLGSSVWGGFRLDPAEFVIRSEMKNPASAPTLTGSTHGADLPGPAPPTAKVVR